MTTCLLLLQLSVPPNHQSLNGRAPATLLPAYWAAVRDYQVTGSLDRAQRILGNWPRREFEDVLELALKAPDGPRVAAAAVFHVEIAQVVAPVDPDGALQHIRFGERFLRGLAGLQPETVAPGFVGRWYAVAASTFVAQTDLLRARPIIDRGIERAPDSAHLRALAGAVEDMAAQLQEPDGAQGSAGSQVAMRREAATRFDLRARLVLAEREYRQALQLDPSLIAARLRLGRALFLLDRHAEARALLEGARQDAVATGDRYLVRLFLGELYARAGQLDAAAAVLDDARTLAPDRQTAWLAQAAVEERAGRPDRARALVRDGLAAMTTTSVDEWWDYRNGALDREGLQWLRARIRR